MSLAEDVRHDSRTNPSTCQKIKYSNRNDTPGIKSDQRSPLVSEPGPTSGTPQGRSWTTGPGPQRPARRRRPGPRLRTRLRLRAHHGQPRRDRRAPARARPGGAGRRPHRDPDLHHPGPARRAGDRLRDQEDRAAYRRRAQKAALPGSPGAARAARAGQGGLHRVEVGNVAATLLILRATDILTPGTGSTPPRRSRSRCT